MPIRTSFRLATFALATLVAGAVTLTADARPGQDVPPEKAGDFKPITPGQWRRDAAAESFLETRAEQPPSAVPDRVVYGTDDRLDNYQVTDPLHQQLSAAACIIVDSSELTNNGNGTYTLLATRWTTQGGTTICASEPFKNQYQVGFCSGFLVGPQLLATAGHCITGAGDCTGSAFVFGFDQLAAGTGPGSDPFLTIPADNVYFCSGIVNRAQAGDLDHCVLTLDRPVVGRNPVQIRRTGAISTGDPLVMVGHPVALPKKVEAGGECKNPNGATQWFFANVDAYGGNSGSMVANRTTGVVEGILVRGNTDFTVSGGCVVSNVCPNTGCTAGDWEECSKTTGFSAYVPELGLAVSPAAGPSIIAPVGGPFTPDPVVYTLSNPTSNPLNYSVSIVGGGTAPLLLDGGPGPISGTIPATSNTTVTVSLGASAASLGAGSYASTVEFSDTTNSITVNRVHALEIGQTGFDTTPAGGLSSGGPVGGPFSGTQAYTITSNRPTSVNVRISPSDSWITVNGVSAPLDVNLSSLGSSAAVTIGFDPVAAGALVAGIHNGTVSFTNLGGGLGAASRPVTLDVGRYTYTYSGPAINIPDNVPAGITSTLNVPDAFCVGDADAEVNITHPFIGDLIVELVSPAGTVVRLHNRTGSSDDNIIKLYNDGATNPDGPGVLADFNGQGAQGVWTLKVSDNAGADVGALNSWALKIAASASPCPPAAFNLSVNVPHTVTSPIVMTGASTTASPLSFTILSLPANGALRDPADNSLITTVPYTLQAGGDQANYKPTALYVGPDSFTFRVSDALDSTAATVSIAVGIPAVIHDFPLDSNPGWTAGANWAYGVPTGAGGDPSGGYTGANVYGYNLAGAYANGAARTYLTTGALNLSGTYFTKLSFRRWLGIEQATYDHAGVEISTNGTTWTTIWENPAGTGLSILETAWSLQTYDISAIADNQPTVYIRWFLGTTDSSLTYGGWNLDDIQVSGVVPPVAPPPCPGDANNDGFVNFADITSVLVNFGTDYTPGTGPGDANHDGPVNFADVTSVLVNFGSNCGA